MEELSTTRQGKCWRQKTSTKVCDHVVPTVPTISDAPNAAVLQRLAVEKLHGNELLAVLLADIVYGADVGVIQSGCGLRSSRWNGASA
jgi:hypothetical protein